jgi:hypothetical protein
MVDPGAAIRLKCYVHLANWNGEARAFDDQAANRQALKWALVYQQARHCALYTGLNVRYSPRRRQKRSVRTRPHSGR